MIPSHGSPQYAPQDHSCSPSLHNADKVLGNACNEWNAFQNFGREHLVCCKTIQCICYHVSDM